VNIRAGCYVGPIMRNFLILVCLWLLGCTYEIGEDDDVTTPKGFVTPEHYGREKVFAPGSLPFLPKSRSVLSLPRAEPWRVPRVQSMIVSVQNEDADMDQRYFLRWVLRSGIGGARTQVVFDAIGFTRLALPIEQVDLSLAVEPWIVDFPDEPGGTVTAHAYIGDGNIGELQPGPTYTQRFSCDPVGAGDPVDRIAIPAGASRFRIMGEEAAVSTPFTPDLTVIAAQGLNTLATWVGGRAPDLNSPNTLHALYYSGDFIPIPAGVTVLLFVNANAGTSRVGFVQFGLDL